MFKFYWKKSIYTVINTLNSIKIQENCEILSFAFVNTYVDCNRNFINEYKNTETSSAF